MDGAKAVKRHNAQYDIFNRLHSIAADQAFVQQVAKEWFNGKFEVVPNQRCGTWYCCPSITYAYFKSTDGHTNNWNFNLRRANIALAKYAEENGGLILVDSTRRGKRMPDALSKTIPIWCTVINRAVHERYRHEDDEGEWSQAYFPPSVVSPSERQQIMDLLPNWTNNLLASNISIPTLTKPLRPFFIHPSSSQPHIPTDAGYTPIICLSASRWIGITGNQDEVPAVTRVGSRNVGFEYIPGAGDDDELWAKGLTPALFWQERETLLSLDRDELENGLEEAKSRSDNLIADLGKLDLDGQPSPLAAVVGAPGPSSRLGLDIGQPISPVQSWLADPSSTLTIYIVGIEKAQLYPDIIYSHSSIPDTIVFALPSPKIDSWAYKDALRRLVTTIRPLLETSTRILLKPGSTNHIDLIIKSADKDDSLSPTFEGLPRLVDQEGSRKTIIPIALLLLCSFSLNNVVQVDALTKGGISNVLLSLVALWPDSNPPRAALKRVNEVLLGRVDR